MHESLRGVWAPTALVQGKWLMGPTRFAEGGWGLNYTKLTGKKFCLIILLQKGGGCWITVHITYASYRGVCECAGERGCGHTMHYHRLGEGTGPCMWLVSRGVLVLAMVYWVVLQD